MPFIQVRRHLDRDGWGRRCRALASLREDQLAVQPSYQALRRNHNLRERLRYSGVPM